MKDDLEVVGLTGESGAERVDPATLTREETIVGLGVGGRADLFADDFDDLAKMYGFEKAKAMVEDERVRIVVMTPRGCTKPRAICVIDLGAMDALGSKGWDDTETMLGGTKNAMEDADR